MKTIISLSLALILSIGISFGQSNRKLRKQQGIEQAIALVESGQFKIMHLDRPYDAKSPIQWNGIIYVNIKDSSSYFHTLQTYIIDSNVFIADFDAPDKRYNLKIDIKTGKFKLISINPHGQRPVCAGTYADIWSINDEPFNDQYWIPIP